MAIPADILGAMASVDQQASTWALSGEAQMPRAFRAAVCALCRLTCGDSPQSEVARPVTPVSDMLAAGYSLERVARALGWRTADGTPDVDRVRREAAQPGSEMDLGEWHASVPA